jgi:hypothetical protein
MKSLRKQALRNGYSAEEEDVEEDGQERCSNKFRVRYTRGQTARLYILPWPRPSLVGFSGWPNERTDMMAVAEA